MAAPRPLEVDASLAEYLDNTIKSADEAQALFGAPVLGTIPAEKFEQGEKRRLTIVQRPGSPAARSRRRVHDARGSRPSLACRVAFRMAPGAGSVRRCASRSGRDRAAPQRTVRVVRAVSGFWEGRRICATEGAGFLGSFLVEQLERRGASDIFVPQQRDYDLVSREAINRLLADARPDIVVHLAAMVGGIGANLANPGRFFNEDAMKSIWLIERPRLTGVAKFVALGIICAYLDFTLRWMLDASRAREKFCWTACVPFEEGIGRRVAWWLAEGRS